MEPQSKSSSSRAAWTYAEIIVYDGDRVLKPTHICGDEITFHDAPQLQSTELTVCVKNGDRETFRIARVLPHEPDATRIPIQLIQTEQKAPAKLTA